MSESERENAYFAFHCLQGLPGGGSGGGAKISRTKPCVFDHLALLQHSDRQVTVAGQLSLQSTLQTYIQVCEKCL